MSFKYVKEGDKRPIASVVVCGRVPSIHEEPVLPPAEEPQEPSEPIETQPTSPETGGESEETPMEPNKPAESPEMEPAESPKKIELSGKVMSLITIMLTCALVYMVIFSIEVPDFFQKCYLLILTTFFTKGTAKAITDK